MRFLRRVVPAVAVVALVALAAPGAVAAGSSRSASVPAPAATHTAAELGEAPIPVAASSSPPAGRRLSADRVLAIAAALPKMKALRREYRGSYAGAYLKGAFRWQVSYFTRGGKKEIGQVIIADLSGRVLEQWTGFQVAWTMARGYPGAFGRHVNALYIWLPLCVLFLLPFVNFRRPLSLLHLDLLVLLSLSISLAFFNHANIYASVPASYPPLLYLLVRMLATLRRRPRRRRPELRLLVPTAWLAVGLVFLVGFRVALNVTDGNVIDVGYASVIGAERIADGRALYGHYPRDNEHGDTYGPVAYETYVPFQQTLGWSGKWDDLPAAHGAALAFDLLAMGLLFLLGRRLRGPTLGVALAYAWAAYPFTLFALESDSNDTLVAVLVLAALLAAAHRGRVAAGARGGMAALAGLTKFAPLALAPLLATYDVRRQDRAPRLGGRWGRVAVFLLAFVAAGALAAVPALTHDSLREIYDRTILYQSNRGAPFSVWGLYGGLGGLELAAQIAAIALAIWLALFPRRIDLAGLAASCAAVLIALQLGLEYWFYLYIPWFFPLVMIALLGRLNPPASRRADAASAPALSRRPAVVASS
jgi:hypothetical protein